MFVDLYSTATEFIEFLKSILHYWALDTPLDIVLLPQTHIYCIYTPNMQTFGKSDILFGKI